MMACFLSSLIAGDVPRTVCDVDVDVSEPLCGDDESADDQPPMLPDTEGSHIVNSGSVVDVEPEQQPRRRIIPQRSSDFLNLHKTVRTLERNEVTFSYVYVLMLHLHVLN